MSQDINAEDSKQRLTQVIYVQSGADIISYVVLSRGCSWANSMSKKELLLHSSLDSLHPRPSPIHPTSKGHDMHR